MRATFWALAALFLTACQTSPPTSATSGMSTEIFEDIPAPRSAVYLHQNWQSFSYRSRTFRCGKFLFEYQGSDADAVRFFKQTMANTPYSWDLEGEEGAGSGSTILVFTKNDDRCTVDVDRVPRPHIEKPSNVVILVRVNYRR